MQMRRLFIVCLLPILVWGGCRDSISNMEDARIRTLASLERVDAFPLYIMHYYDDYDFEEYVQTGNVTTSCHDEDGEEWACTCFAGLNPQGDAVFGRNFDWYDHPALLLFTYPENRYNCVTMVDISYLGYDRTNTPIHNPDALMGAPFIPFDGMNEHGLAVGMMAIPDCLGGNDPDKVTISSLAAVRVMLEQAQTVDEAIDALRPFNIDFGGGPSIHYLVADTQGHSAVIEYINHELTVIGNTETWQVCTNFLFEERDHQTGMQTCWRYQTAWEALEAAQGRIDDHDGMDILQSVAQSNTIWSVVYNMTDHNIHIVMGRKWDERHEFQLQDPD